MNEHSKDNLFDGQDLTCENFEQRIHQLLDDRLTLTGDALLMAHADLCEECSSLIQDYDAVAWSMPLDAIWQSAIESETQLEHAQTSSKTSVRHGNSTSFQLGVAGSIAVAFMLVIGLVYSEKSRTNRSYANAYSAHSTVTEAPRRAVAPPKLAAITTPSVPNIKSAELTTGSIATPFVRQLASYQPPTIMELAQSVNRVKLPDSTAWEKFSEKLDPLSPYVLYSSELPGVRPIQSSVNMTLKFLQQSFSKSHQSHPDLGWTPQRPPAVTI